MAPREPEQYGGKSEEQSHLAARALHRASDSEDPLGLKEGASAIVQAVAGEDSFGGLPTSPGEELGSLLSPPGHDATQDAQPFTGAGGPLTGSPDCSGGLSGVDAIVGYGGRK
jgi:hypothetical protein